MAETSRAEAIIPKIVEALQSKKGLDILLMDLRSSTDTTDFFVLCSGTSDMHVKSLVDEVTEKLAEEGHPSWHVEGYGSRRWVLIDYVDLVVHVFRQEAREFYALERLWGDAQRTSFTETWEESLEDQAVDDTFFAFSKP